MSKTKKEKALQFENQGLIIQHQPFDQHTSNSEHIELLQSQNTHSMTLAEDQQKETVRSEKKDLRSKNTINWKMYIALLIVLGFVCRYYFKQKEQILTFQNQNYILITTAYPLNMNNTPPQANFLSQIFTHKSNYLQIYIPQHSNYYIEVPLSSTTCLTNYRDQCWRENLFLTGTMVQQLEQWAINNIKKGSKVLLFWSQKLSLTILLLSKHLMQFQKSANSIVVMTFPKQPKSELHVLRLNLIKQNSQNIVTFVQAKQSILPEELMGYDIVIGDNAILHEKIIAGCLGNRDFYDFNVQDQIAYNIYSILITTKLVLVYEHQMKQYQKQHYCILQNQIVKLIRDEQNHYKQQIIRRAQQLNFETQPTVFIIESKSGIIKCQTDSNSINQYQKQDKLIISNQDSKIRDTNVDDQSHTQTKQSLQSEFQQPHVIERVELQTMKGILPCKTRNAYEYSETGQYKPTQFKNIEVMSEQTGKPQDLTYLAKFLIYLFRTEEMPFNVLYVQNSQLLGSLIAKINDGNIFIPTNIIKKSEQMIEVLKHNKLDRLLHLFQFSQDIKLFLDRQAIKLLVIDLTYLIQWKRDIFYSSQRISMVLTPRKGNNNEINAVENLGKDKNIKIYVIFKQQNQSYNVECFHDFQLQPYSAGFIYPHDSYYLISRQAYCLEPINPNDYPNIIIHRSMQIQPYDCQSPPDLRTDENIYEQKYIMITNKYDLPYLIPKEQYNMFDIQEAEDQGIIEFLRSNLFSGDRVLFYAESTDNILMNLIAMGIVKKHGSTTFTLLSEQRRNMLRLSAAENGLDSSYEINEIQSYDEFGIEGLLLSFKPTVIFTILDYLERDLPLLKGLEKQSLVLFKYPTYLEAFEQYLSNLIKKIRLYQIIFAPRNELSHECNDFRVEQLVANNFTIHKYGWFAIVV